MSFNSNTKVLEAVGTVVLLSLVTSLGAVIGHYFGVRDGEHMMQVSAVRAGVGEWVVDTSGKTTFAFKRKPE